MIRVDLTLLLFSVSPLYAAGISADFAAGAKLTPAQAAAIETAKPPVPLSGSRQLLGYYAAYPDAPQHRDKRIALILALTQQGNQLIARSHKGRGRCGGESLVIGQA